MNAAAFEINDAGIAVVRDGKLLTVTPGYALFGRDPVKPSVAVGETARRAARLEPMSIETHFWSALDQQPLAQRQAAGRSAADLVYLHLKQIKEQLGDVKSVVCAVPATMRSSQLALLLGIARECGLPLTGFIDAGVAAATAWPERGRFIYLDVHLHQAVATSVQIDDDVRFERSENAPRAGVAALYDKWMRLIARRYVANTRFDPLHEAAGDQALFDRLPSWLESMSGRQSMELETSIGEQQHRVLLTHEEFRIEAAPIYEQILRALRRLRHAGQPVTIGLSAQAAMLPGLPETLATLHDCRVVAFPPGAAASAAEAHTGIWSGKDNSAELLRVAPSLAFLKEESTGAVPFTLRELALLRSAGAGTPPTHVLYRGQAYALGPEPLVVGTAAEASGLKSLQITGANAGISRHHCSLYATPSARQATVIDHSRHGIWLNDELVVDRAQLRAGDRLHMGRPGVTLELIAID